VEKLEHCPVCNSNQFTELFTCKDYVASGESFTIVSCQDCGLQFTNPRPSETEIGKYYESSQYISHAGTDKSELGVTYKIYDWVRNYSIGSKLTLIKKYHSQGKLLDLGCGLGYFLQGVKLDKTFEGSGADVSDEAIKYVKSTFNIDVMPENELAQSVAANYDIITQWHVMEHVHRLEERMKLLKNILKPDGTMFIAVPISNSFDAKHYKQFWDGYDVPRHLYHFSKKSMDNLMEANGLQILKVLPMWFDSFYVSLLSEKYKKNPIGPILAVIVGLLSNIIAFFKGNSSSLIYVVKQK
jgi:SAM-dependent methyltransferase